MTTNTNSRRPGGFSLVEVIVMVAITGILSFIAIVSYGNVREGSEGTIAREVAETLNLGLKKFAQINHEITLAGDDDATTDEFLVLRSLQWRDPLDPSPGAPYVRPNYNPVASSDSADYRIRWNGRLFTVLGPGSAGQGLKVDFGAEDYGPDHSFPTGYAPVP